MMGISPEAFFLLAGVTIACSLAVILLKNPVSSAFSLVLALFCFAGMYALMQAHLMAVLQVLVYTGAITVLFVFVIMLLNADVPSFDLGRASLPLRVAVGAFGVVGFGTFVWVFRGIETAPPKGQFSEEAIRAAGGNARVLSELMFSDYILPFELTSILLLSAIVGSVAIALRRAARPAQKQRRKAGEAA